MCKRSHGYVKDIKKLYILSEATRRDLRAYCATVRTEGQMSFEKDFVYARMLKIENVKWINRSSQYLLIHEGNVTNLSSSLSLSLYIVKKRRSKCARYISVNSFYYFCLDKFFNIYYCCIFRFLSCTTRIEYVTII